MQKQTLLGIDTGGTFTDFVFLDTAQNAWRVHKVLSTPSAPQDAIIRGIEELGLTEQVKRGNVSIVHGTTVATNAALEGKGAKTAYITNLGMKDVIRIGRQTRADLYSLTPGKRSVPIDPSLLFELGTRTDANGLSLKSASESELQHLKNEVVASNPDAIAINLLFSFLDPEPEKQIEALFSEDYFVSRSSEILPEYREYERGATTWVNSWLGPRIKTYMDALRRQLENAPIAIMQSSGLTIDASLAARRAVNLLLSGPAGGLSAAKYISETIQRNQLLTFDMGGTSTDVALIDGDLTLTSEGEIAGIPIGIPMADIHTIGAGGGSIAYIDSGGLLKVGPESAGADPGPACYGQGGTKPTVTDANLVLGNLRASSQLADDLTLDLDAAENAIETLAVQLNQTVTETAKGIIAIANEHMVQALRVISIQKGHDPRQFSLVCFGGAGGLHVCDIADALDMREIIVPINSGVLSALGMLTTHPGRELSQTVQVLLNEIAEKDIQSTLDQISKQGNDELRAEGVLTSSRRNSLELRYQGQTSTLSVDYIGDSQSAAAAFELAHEKQFGHKLNRQIELLNCRVHLEAVDALPELPLAETISDSENTPENTFRRAALPIDQKRRGPSLILDDHATVHVTQSWRFKKDQFGHLILSKVTTSD